MSGNQTSTKVIQNYYCCCCCVINVSPSSRLFPESTYHSWGLLFNVPCVRYGQNCSLNHSKNEHYHHQNVRKQQFWHTLRIITGAAEMSTKASILTSLVVPICSPGGNSPRLPRTISSQNVFLKVNIPTHKNTTVNPLNSGFHPGDLRPLSLSPLLPHAPPLTTVLVTSTLIHHGTKFPVSKPASVSLCRPWLGHVQLPFHIYCPVKPCH